MFIPVIITVINKLNSVVDMEQDSSENMMLFTQKGANLTFQLLVNHVPLINTVLMT